MPSTLKILFVCFLCALSIPVKARGQAVPDSSWENLSNGIAVAVIMDKNFVSAYVKNTSTSSMQISGDVGHLVRFFYIDSNNIKHPLRNKSEDGDFVASSKVSGSTVVPQDGKAPFRIQIELSPKELTAIKACPVFCRFSVLNSSTKQDYKVESTPKVLNSCP